MPWVETMVFDLRVSSGKVFGVRHCTGFWWTGITFAAVDSEEHMDVFISCDIFVNTESFVDTKDEVAGEGRLLSCNEQSLGFRIGFNLEDVRQILSKISLEMSSVEMILLDCTEGRGGNFRKFFWSFFDILGPGFRSTSPHWSSRRYNHRQCNAMKRRYHNRHPPAHNVTIHQYNKPKDNRRVP